MLGPNEIEQIISLIEQGFDLNLLSLELNIPIEEMQEYKRQLNLRRFAKESIKSEKIQEKVPMLKRKNSNLRKKKNEGLEKRSQKEANIAEAQEDDKKEAIRNYEETIRRYKEEIARNPQSSLNKRNLLAFAYFKAGKIEEARDELMSLIEERGSYIAYRQLVYLEKCQGNFEDAKLWGTACLEQFPNDINIRYQLISVATEEKDNEEIIRQLRAIINIAPESKRGKGMLENILNGEER